MLVIVIFHFTANELANSDDAPQNRIFEIVNKKKSYRCRSYNSHPKAFKRNESTLA